MSDFNMETVNSCREQMKNLDIKGPSPQMNKTMERARQLLVNGVASYAYDWALRGVVPPGEGVRTLPLAAASSFAPVCCPDKVTAVIPVRGGSTRVPDKWKQKVGGRSLLERKIGQLQDTAQVGKVVVATDSQDVAGHAKATGAEVLRLRPEYCDGSRSWGEMNRFVASEVDGDVLMFALCTCPFMTPQIYMAMIHWFFANDGEAEPEGGASVISCFNHRGYFLTTDATPIYPMGLDHRPTQDNPPTMQFTCGATVARRMNMVKWAYFHGPRPTPYLVDRIAATDIDNPEDLRIAQAVAQVIEGGAE